MLVCLCRETSHTSVASLSELPRIVDLRTPYQSLMSHLRASDVKLDGWKRLPREEHIEEEAAGRASRAVSISGEIPPAGFTERSGSVVDLNLRPRRRKKLLQWGLLGGALGAAAAFLLMRR